MQAREKDDRRDWVIVIFIILIGLLCIGLAGGWALRLTPSWKLNSNMGSNLDPNSDFLTARPNGFLEPLDPSILTQPAWIGLYLTPGASFLTQTPMPTRTKAPPATVTITSTPLVINSPTNAPIPTNTLIYFPPPPTKEPRQPTSTPTDVPIVLSADLGITKTDNAGYYAPNISVQYIIVAGNAGPSSVTGANVVDTFSSNLTGITWTCAGSGGASCTASGTGDINDLAVNLPAGGSVQYTVNATVIGSPSGSLANTANINAPAGITDSNTGNNSAADTDTLIVANPLPPGSIGNIPAGTYSDYQFGTSLVVSPGSGSYLIYYPQNSAPPPSLEMDVVILQIGNGKNWYTVFIWGNGVPDTNTDINPTDCPSETDNCLITLPPTNSPGVTINLNGVVPDDTYYYIRIISPSGPPPGPPLTQADSGDGLNVNTITKFP